MFNPLAIQHRPTASASTGAVALSERAAVAHAFGGGSYPAKPAAIDARGPTGRVLREPAAPPGGQEQRPAPFGDTG